MGEKCEHPFDVVHEASVGGRLIARCAVCHLALQGTEVLRSAKERILYPTEPTARAKWKAEVLLHLIDTAIRETSPGDHKDMERIADGVIAYAEGGEGEEGLPLGSVCVCGKYASQHVPAHSHCPGCECGQC